MQPGKHMTAIKIIALVATLSLLWMAPVPVSAQDQTGGVPGDWLSQYNTARSVGIGGAYVAAAEGPLGAIWNPASLSYMFQNEVVFESSILFESTSLNSLSFAVPSRRFPSLGVSIIALGSGDFEKTNELNESLGTFGERDMAFVLSASKPLMKSLSLGVNLKVVNQSIEEFSSAGFGADIGALYDVMPQVRLGLSLLNIAGPSLNLRDTEETFPFEFRGGAAISYLKGRGVLSAEIDHRSGPGATYFVGTEFWAHEKMALRVGYFNEEPSGGFSFLAGPAFQFDYGMSDSELGVVHRVGLSYKFGGFFANSYATPEVFSPLGQQSVTKFNLKSKTKTETESWNVEIVDKHNQVVRRFGGQGGPPAHVMWDGKDDSGLTLPDGKYSFRLTVTDSEDRVITSHERTVEITTAGPQGAVPVQVN